MRSNRSAHVLRVVCAAVLLPVLAFASAASEPGGSAGETPLDISVEELDRMRREGEPHVLLDIREPHELAISALSGSLDIPMDSVPERLDELPVDGTIAVLCRTGNRSMKVTKWLRERGYEGATNVRGGINDWAEWIDPSLPQY